jgi:hypothetical protein
MFAGFRPGFVVFPLCGFEGFEPDIVENLPLGVLFPAAGWPGWGIAKRG